MSIFFRILLLSAVYVCSANAAESRLNIQAISATGINNFRAPESDVLATGPVSYTHLTLPTICSV